MGYTEKEYDAVIIGSGPSGQQAAYQAVKLGKRVAVIERLPDPGGNCLYNGTIPSKTLRQAILDLTGFHEQSFYGDTDEILKVNITDLNHRLFQVIDEEKRVIASHLQKNSIDFIEANAQFLDPHTLGLTDSAGSKIGRLKADLLFIATGSKPRHPVDIPFDDEVILDSTRLLHIHRVPKTMIVLGGGVIGSEYGSFFAALKTQVTIVEREKNILPMLDIEIGAHLHSALQKLGMKFIGEVVAEKIWREGNRAFVSLSNGKILEADTLLFALGRTANVDELKIENAGIITDAKGYIIVNDHFQTSMPHIYAVGDVIGGPCLASTSMEQGYQAARHACKMETYPFPTFYPKGIYTIPEISTFGYTEEELKRMGFHYEVGRAYYRDIAKSHITGFTHGMIKIVFHKETKEILGVHIIGRDATEIIHVGQLVQCGSGKITQFTNLIFNYPTYAEGYRIAALDGLSKL
ncbi:MAG: Si-specific NAD(P)(+) transhydrogenase [Verrucomicrobia bacterium]|nr:Si-specific NAD(P)(+) transhydrogenase [Verrucomicrobiota bacterium]